MINPRLAELVDATQARRAERQRERAELQAARQHGLRQRHHTKLTRQQEEAMTTQPDTPSTTTRQNPVAEANDDLRTTEVTTSPGDRSPGALRDVTRTPADPPPRLAGIRAGYPGKAELGLADNVLRAALSKLARDPDPEARIAGAQLAAEAADTLLRLAGRAEQASTAYKRQQQAATKLGARLDRRRTEVQSRTVQKGHTP